MNWISYLFQASLLFFLFYGFYWLFLKEETYHQINRAVLLGIILVIVTLPLIPVPEPVIEIKQQFLPIENIAFTTEIPEETISLPESMEATGPVVAEPTIQINWQKSLLLLYLVGVIALGLRFMFALASIFGLLIWSNLKKQEDFILAFSDRHFQPFSFFKIIFTGRDDQSEKAREQILIHESVHAREWHCIDIILVELFSILFWFHPFTGMLKRSIKLNLEYIADATVLRSGANRKAYQYSLLKVGTNQKDLLLTNSFNHSFIKKRIIMMNIKKSPEWKKLKYLLFLPLFLTSYTFLNTAHAQTVNKPV